MNVFEFILGIMIITTIGSLFRHRIRYRRMAVSTEGDTRGLVEEVRMLRDRVATLERITIEKENSLEREIEQLRDR